MGKCNISIYHFTLRFWFAWSLEGIYKRDKNWTLMKMNIEKCDLNKTERPEKHLFDGVHLAVVQVGQSRGGEAFGQLCLERLLVVLGTTLVSQQTVEDVLRHTCHVHCKCLHGCLHPAHGKYMLHSSLPWASLKSPSASKKLFNQSHLEIKRTVFSRWFCNKVPSSYRVSFCYPSFSCFRGCKANF